MNLGQILDAFYSRMVDAGAVQQWPRPEATDFANQAEREACERANLIEDATTPAVCQIAGVANTGTYALHGKIIAVSSATWDGRFLKPIAREALNSTYPNGWKAKTGNPYHFIDPQQKYLTLFPIPTVAKAIELVAYRYPLADMDQEIDSPEIDERHHFNLVDWMMHLAYLKQDTEAYDAQAAEKADARFTANFGVKIDANTRRTQRARTPNVVRFNPHW